MYRTLLAGIAGTALVLAACGGEGPDAADATGVTLVETTAPSTDGAVAPTVPDTPAPPATAPATTATTAVSPDDVPQAIISLSPTATEMLYAVGAGDQVLAVDEFSNYPDAAVEKQAGISGYEPNVEAIAGLGPDLIVTDGTNPDLLGQLDSLDIAHWEGPAAVGFDDVYDQLAELGALTGHVAEASELVDRMQADVAAVKDGLPLLDQPLTYYHELDPSYFSVTSQTFIGAVYGEIGLSNIADAVGDGNPYPQLSAEFIVDQDPDLIFLADTIWSGESAETVAARDGWGGVSAVQNGGVVEMNDDVASRWGPRIVEYLRIAGDAVAQVAAAQTG